MKLEDWCKVTELTDHIVVSLAALIGGIWVLFRLNRERTDEAALNISVSVFERSHRYENDYLVAIIVKLANQGKTKIQAKTNRTKDGYAFDDGPEKLRNCCSLQIKKFSACSQKYIGHIDWFEGGPVEPVLGLKSEINMLIEYEDPANNNQIDFWLEPGEEYRLEMPLVLETGVYLAKVTFVAAGSDSNFWSRIFTFAVPVLPTGRDCE
jgi:hypothetical protein